MADSKDALAAELEGLTRGLPPQVLALGLEATLGRVRRERRAALAPLVGADPERVLAGLLALPAADAAEVVAIMLEVAAQVASESGLLKLPDDDEDDDAPAVPPAPRPTPTTTETIGPSADELGALVRGLPPAVLGLALTTALARVSDEVRAALSDLADTPDPDPARVVTAVLGLPASASEELACVLLEVAAQIASDSGPLELPTRGASAARLEAAVRPPEGAASTFEEELGTLLRGLPADVLRLALQKALDRVQGDARAALAPFAGAATPDPARLLAAVLALPLESGDEIGGLLLDAAAQVASGGDDDDEDDEPAPRPTARRRRGPLVLDPGLTFSLPAAGKRPARRVTVERRMAEGGGGIVWLARDQDGAPIIVKTGKVAGEVPLSLRVERAILERLDHPNLVRLLGSHTDAAGNLLLCLELLSPNPVLLLSEARIRARVTSRVQAPGAQYLAPPPAVALDLVHDLLRGLEALHAGGYVHNDVKLANFLMALDQRTPDVSDQAYFQALERGAYHGVLIDAGGIRNVETLDEINRGDADPALPPIELTPVYAPPEALLGRLGDPDERPYYSTAIDVYAAALVTYTTITGYVPYSHLRTPPKDLPAILEAKRAERRGGITPIAIERLREARFQDSRFRDPDRLGHEHCRARFEGALTDFLLRRVDPDPAARGTMAEMRRDFAALFSIRARTRAEFTGAKKIGERGPRLYDQHLFATAVGDANSRLVQATGLASPGERAPTGRYERPGAAPAERPGTGRLTPPPSGRLTPPPSGRITPPPSGRITPPPGG